MTARLFLSQVAVERCAASGRAELGGGTLVLAGGALDGARLELEPALHVKSVSGGGADPHALVGKVRPLAPLRAGGAEVVGDSMLLADTAYDVEHGYLACPDPDVLRRIFPAGGGAPSGVTPEGQSDADALARFLLDRLS